MHPMSVHFIKHTLKDLQPHVDPNTVIVGVVSTPLPAIDRSSRPKVQKETYN
jgi:hypothetical protein